MTSWRRVGFQSASQPGVVRGGHHGGEQLGGRVVVEDDLGAVVEFVRRNLLPARCGRSCRAHRKRGCSAVLRVGVGTGASVAG